MRNVLLSALAFAPGMVSAQHPDLSIAVLERAPRALDEANLLAAAKRAFGDPAFADPEKGFVTAKDTTAMVRFDATAILVSVTAEPAFDDVEAFAKKIDEMRLRQAVLNHRAVLRLLVLDGPKSSAARLREVSRLAAELLDQDSLALSFSTEPRLFAITDTTKTRLGETNPVRAMIRPDKVPILPAEDQAELDKAAEQARADWPKLLAAWQKKPKFAAVKMKFAEGEAAEHMWVSVAELDEQGGKGKLNNEPGWLKNIKAGAPVAFAKEQVEDWLVDTGDKQPLGGYSLAVFEAQEKRRRARAEGTKPERSGDKR